jgi:TRAP-type mannitol/chloroaromatic compound transport system permease small subunit
VQQLVAILNAISEWTGRAVAWLTLAMVAMTFAVVVLRYGFSIGSIAAQESITYMHAVVFLLGAAYTLRHDRHVRVDIFYQRFSARTQAWVDLAGTLLLLAPTCGYIFWVSLDYVAASWALMEESREAGGLPLVYLLKSLIPLAAITLLLQGLSMSLERILVLRRD